MNLLARLATVVALLLSPFAALAQPIATPSEHLKMSIGEDRVVADYRQIRDYFAMLDRVSPRVAIETLGETTLGEPMIMAVISSEANIANLARYKEIARKVSDPRGLSEAERAKLAAEGRAIVLVTCNIHSTEIASSQMAMEWAHALATTADPKKLRELDEVILLLVPSLNPDGQIMETEWYRKHLGTKYEGGPMPWLYHHYVGHDNNRDWFMLTQKETRAMSRALYHEWYPQLFVDEHQMGREGPRMFIPPFADPVDPDVHPLIWREVNLVGSNMAIRLEEAGKAGVIYGYGFDAYWMGGTRNTAWWKNITGLLLEVASARFASPVYIDPNELEGGRKGLVEYKPQINYPNPWKGGWWRMRDIMDYERIASDALLEIAADRREDLLRNKMTRARLAVESARPRDAYRIPGMQRDLATAKRLAELMADHNVDVIIGENGDYWIPLAQPYKRFVEELMEPQRYPEVRLTGSAEILRPYDVATWTLPMMMGVSVEKMLMPAILFDAPRLAPWFRRDAVVAPQLQPAPAYAVEYRSPEAARVINAALKGGGAVAFGTAVESDLTQAPVPVQFAAGTIYLDPKAAEAAREVAAEARIPIVPLAKSAASAKPVRAPRVGIYKPWRPSMDEGWTRFLLETFGFEPKTIDNKMLRGGRLDVDVIVVPSIAKSILESGRPKADEERINYFVELPEPYQGGIGAEGARALKSFVEGGGTLVAFSASTEWVISEFNIPVRNVLAKSKPGEFSSPGSLLAIEVSNEIPLGWGMPPKSVAFVDSAIAYETALPAVDMERWVIARYPDSAPKILLSGWITGASKLERRAAAVAFTYGKGKLVLFGFRPQNRAQTHATFPLVFNSLYWSVMDKAAEKQAKGQRPEAKASEKRD
ncbi:MAG: M14 family metallopeptidase [Thermoanaerobaculia bacterium]